MSFGIYPEVPLAEARSRRAKARSSVAAGSDPNQELAKPNTFGEIALTEPIKAIALPIYL